MSIKVNEHQQVKKLIEFGLYDKSSPSFKKNVETHLNKKFNDNAWTNFMKKLESPKTNQTNNKNPIVCFNKNGLKEIHKAIHEARTKSYFKLPKTGMKKTRMLMRDRLSFKKKMINKNLETTQKGELQDYKNFKKWLQSLDREDEEYLKQKPLMLKKPESASVPKIYKKVTRTKGDPYKKVTRTKQDVTKQIVKEALERKRKRKPKRKP